MDGICPLLALVTDGRTVVAGFDPDHRCTAESPAVALDRATQHRLCLQAGHVECPRYREWVARGTVSPGIPRPAPDATFVRTRLVIEADGARRSPALASPPSPTARRALVGGAAALVAAGALAAAGYSTNGFGLVAALASTPQPIATPTASATPTAAATATSRPTPTATPAPTPTASPTPTLAPTATPRPTQQVYVVQAGDTLSAIANKFGTSAQAIADANGIAVSSILHIGQQLIIP